MSEEEQNVEGVEVTLARIRKYEEPPTHHNCKCRQCNPITAMAERVDAFLSSLSLLSKGSWAEDDQPSVRETMMLADWLLYGPAEDNGD